MYKFMWIFTGLSTPLWPVNWLHYVVGLLVFIIIYIEYCLWVLYKIFIIHTLIVQKNGNIYKKQESIWLTHIGTYSRGRIIWNWVYSIWIPKVFWHLIKNWNFQFTFSFLFSTKTLLVSKLSKVNCRWSSPSSCIMYSFFVIVKCK